MRSDGASSLKKRFPSSRPLTAMRVSITLFTIILPLALQADESLNVLQPDVDGITPDHAFENWLYGDFLALTEQRSDRFEVMLKSEAACREWQTERRAFFLDRIGGLPDRNPLNPRITGTLKGEGYRIEKVILETRPSFHLTANLYLPDAPGPWPAVLVPCGHSHNGKASGQYQLACRLLARNGMAAMCYDPIGQGERYQLLDPAGATKTFEDAAHVQTPHPAVRLLCTTEHTMIGISSALIGSNVAQYRIWDGMRVIDYLQGRPDILADKIGCTGNSGGGTATAYLMALDDRVVAAAPGCYLTTFRRLIETKGPQDGEQNIFGQVAFGMDQADYCLMRAPKPTLIAAGTRDATFAFDGTWEVFRDAKRFYSRLGHPDMVDIAAPDAPHGFTLQLREAVTRFMARHLLGEDIEVREVEKLPDTFTDVELRSLTEPDFTEQQLQCTPEGQVLLMPGERSAFEINAEIAQQLKAARSAPPSRASIREVIGAAAELPEPRVEVVGRVEREGYHLEKLALAVEDAFQLPALLFVPGDPSGDATLYLHGESMKIDAAPGGPIEQLVKSGQIVLAAELRGIGETETGSRRRAWGAGQFGPDNLEIFTAYLMGKSYVGMRTDDALQWAGFLRTKSENVNLIARGEAAIPALHAAALDAGRFESVTLEQMLPSWQLLTRGGESFNQTVNLVHGVLRHYDLPELVDLVGRERVRIVQPVDGMGIVLVE